MRVRVRVRVRVGVTLAAATARSSARLCRLWKTASFVSSSELSLSPAAPRRVSAAALLAALVTRQLGSCTSLGLTTSIMRGEGRSPK